MDEQSFLMFCYVVPVYQRMEAYQISLFHRSPALSLMSLNTLGRKDNSQPSQQRRVVVSRTYHTRVLLSSSPRRLGEFDTAISTVYIDKVLGVEHSRPGHVM